MGTRRRFSVDGKDGEGRREGTAGGVFQQLAQFVDDQKDSAEWTRPVAGGVQESAE
jgi:hypothetical protein